MSEAPTKLNGAIQAVLVVEDEGLIRMMLADELIDAGFLVIEAENADAAIGELTAHPEITVVLTDVRMPGSIDGVGLAAWMREHRPKIPIVITSGFVTPPDIETINPAIARIVPKPYRPQDAADWLRVIGLQPLDSTG